MTRVRILGPRAQRDSVLEALQDIALVHLAPTKLTGSLRAITLAERQAREISQLRSVARDLEVVANRYPVERAEVVGQAVPVTVGAASVPEGFAPLARHAGRVRRQLERIDAATHALEEERTEVSRLLQFAAAFRTMPHGSGNRMHAYHLLLRGDDEAALPRLQEALERAIGDQFVVETKSLDSGDLAAALLVPRGDVQRVDQLLAQAGVHELPLPESLREQPFTEIVPDFERRQRDIDARLRELSEERDGVLETEGPKLVAGRASVEDRLLSLDALEQVAETQRSFVIEGWVPAAGLSRLGRLLSKRFGEQVVLETVGREEWRGEDVPVVLSNPRLFRPFEMVTRLLPLPRYGTIDPTPFVAVFFPMFFGLILGDIGYGLILAALALVLRLRSRAGDWTRALAEITGACALFATIFGFAFGEFFGDLGSRWLGLQPLLFDRGEAMVPFLVLAVSLGVVHVALGLFLGILNTIRGEPRHALGRGVMLVMLLLVVAALLAALEVLPQSLLTPMVIALLIAFPMLIVIEGVVAPIELLSTVGNVLSYARIMALGTASVMMAITANRLAGTIGGVIVGVIFALLFHLVNFVLGVFAPTVHGLRLHYVEFFGKFYSPGGQQYQPFSHWRPNGAEAGKFTS